MESEVRVRFAPSPTGHLHIGNVRTAILNWIFARQQQGKFVLRIEDTDAERSSAASEHAILDDLRWLGLAWDEGPDIGGPYGPYRQSQRLEIYRQHLKVLAEKGAAYPCFCSEADLQQKRDEAVSKGETPKYDGTCLRFGQEERRRLLESGTPHAWRFHVAAGELKWLDLVKGELSFDAAAFGDFVLVRRDGLPTYNFAAVVDDATMKMSHVIRGDDHVSNTPKQLLLYRALGFETPQFAHIPMILGPDRTRLSKRHGATSLREFREKGYLPEALINFLSLLSWSSQSGEEVLSVERIIEEFDFARMSRSQAVFDIVKLNWMNGQYIRELKLETLVDLARPFLKDAGIDVEDEAALADILSLMRNYVEYLAQISDLVRPFYETDPPHKDGEAIAVYSKDGAQKIYWAFLRHLKNYDHLSAEVFRTIMKAVQKETGIMGKELWVPIRVALTGKLHGPELPRVAEILGKAKCERFISAVLT
ncbi:MAG: glutamate--tRNA ligase [Calditrichaeota bacterium]|nr:MAG: glutamate--tRNA ligase [Calditrichota bacterium]